MSGPIGVKPTRSDADIRADLAELARWVNARDEDPSLLLFALATDVEPLLLRVAQAEARLANAEIALNELGDVRRPDWAKPELS
jgi:hypothetical protein